MISVAFILDVDFGVMIFTHKSTWSSIHFNCISLDISRLTIIRSKKLCHRTTFFINKW